MSDPSVTESETPSLSAGSGQGSEKEPGRPDKADHEQSRAFERAAQSPLATILHRPPALIARGLVYIIIGLLGSLLVWAALSEVTDIVEAPTQLKPEGRLSLVETAVRGVVRDIKVQEGDHVSAGQVLVELQSEDVSTMLSALRASAVTLAQAKRDFRSIVPTRIAAIRKRMAMEKAEATAQRRIHELALEEIALEKARLAQASGRQDAESHRRALELRKNRIENEIRMTSRALEAEVTELAAKTEDLLTVAERAMNQAQIDYDRVKSVTFLTLRGVDAQYLNAAAAGESLSSNLAVITAPIDGVVAEISVQSQGEILERGETVLKIIPANVALVAQLRIPGSDIGKVREGQDIRFKFDAFPFSQHGVLLGKVEAIQPRAIVDPRTGETYYNARSRLNRDYFLVQRERSPLLPGMTAVGEISTDRHSLLSLLFQPFAALVFSPDPSGQDPSGQDPPGAQKEKQAALSEGAPKNMSLLEPRLVEPQAVTMKSLLSDQKASIHSAHGPR